MSGRIEAVGVDEIGCRLGFSAKIEFSEEFRSLPLSQWKFEADDCVLRYVFRNFRPCRHLEFGTWLGDGVVRCVEECDATVWTVNALEGETLADGSWAYSARHSEVPGGGGSWAESMTTDHDTWVR